MKDKAARVLLGFATGSVCYCIYLFGVVLPWSVRHRYAVWLFPYPNASDFYSRTDIFRLWWQIAERDVLLIWLGFVLFIVPALVASHIGKKYKATLNHRSIQIGLGVLSLAASILSIYGIKIILPPLPMLPAF